MSGFGLIELLALVAGVVLAFTGTYPRPLFDLLLGLNRWVIRVVAYAALMTDSYPPFCLDMGGSEPGSTLTVPTTPPEGSSASAVSRPGARTNGWSAGPVMAVAVGSLAALMSMGLIASGAIALWADTTQRQGGFVTSPTAQLDTEAYAVVTDNIEIYADGPDWILPRTILGDARVRVESADGEIFVGVARTSDIRRFLRGVFYAVVPDLTKDTGHNLQGGSGGAPSTQPRSQDFWIASSEGVGTQSIRWPLSNGAWSVIVLNADGSKGLSFEGDVGTEAPVLAPIAIGLLVGAGGLLLVAIALIGVGISRSRGPSERAPA